jgi:hypothetical protein
MSGDWIMSADSELNKGPWYEANKFCLDSESYINKKIELAKQEISLNKMDFSNTECSNLNQDFDKLYSQLDHVSEDHINVANHLRSTVKDYVNNTMIPKMLSLEIILLLQAFNVKGKPIIDLFHKFEDNKRVMREPAEFAVIVGGGFMALFYKVSIS